MLDHSCHVSGSVQKNWQTVRAEILRRDQFICSYCLDDARHVDHMIPVIRMGPFLDSRNLTAACSRCNLSKGSLSPIEWFDRDWAGRVPPWFTERHPEMVKHG